jgi:hypothetical protein
MKNKNKKLTLKMLQKVVKLMQERAIKLDKNGYIKLRIYI